MVEVDDLLASVTEDLTLESRNDLVGSVGGFSSRAGGAQPLHSIVDNKGGAGSVANDEA